MKKKRREGRRKREEEKKRQRKEKEKKEYCVQQALRHTLGVRLFSVLLEKTSTAWVGAHSAPAVSLPCLGSLVHDIGAAASGFAFTLCDYAATVGVVLSNDPDAHVDGIGERIELGSCRMELAR